MVSDPRLLTDLCTSVGAKLECQRYLATAIKVQKTLLRYPGRSNLTPRTLMHAATLPVMGEVLCNQSLP